MHDEKDDSIWMWAGIKTDLRQIRPRIWVLLVSAPGQVRAGVYTPLPFFLLLYAPVTYGVYFLGCTGPLAVETNDNEFFAISIKNTKVSKLKKYQS